MTCIMRSVVLALGISIDGYIARPDGTFDFLFMPPDFSMAEFFASVDTAVMGRKTYEVSKAMGGDPAGSRIKNYVFSRSLPAGEREGFTFVDTRVLRLLSIRCGKRATKTSG
jgi:dihydrofolate reductase